MIEENRPEGQGSTHLKFYQIALMYVGALMGAGFASGKEMWQFFGVFGMEGLKGIAVAAAFFVVFGYFSVANAKMAQTADFGTLISPIENPKVTATIGAVMSVFLWMAYLSMVSAGGALIEEQTGLHHSLGSALYMLLVVVTAVKGFAIVSSRIRKVTPVLVCGSLLICICLLVRDGAAIGGEVVAEKSPLAQNWFSAAVAFVTYNLTAAVPILGNCQRHADWRQAKDGALAGAAALTVCCTLLYLTTQTNPQIAQEISLPMLGFAQTIAPALRTVYACFLLIAIFATATSCLYGITTVLPQKRRIVWIWGIALLGYGLSLFGFNQLVAVLYPIGGYFSMIFFAMMAINFFRLRTKTAAESEREAEAQEALPQKRD